MIVGYARVSTDSQTLDAQQSALAAAGAERVFALTNSREPAADPPRARP
jgi:DNA invertase Pin-like site-specific DNA recombinase